MEEKDFILERYELTIERVNTIVNEETVSEQFRDYFQKTAKFILEISQILKRLQEKPTESCSIEALKEENAHIYNDIMRESYYTSYANPAYAVSVLGDELGRLLCFLYAELRGEIAYVYEKKLLYLTIYNELFIEIYNCFEEVEVPSYKELREIIYWFVNDYCDVFVADWIEAQINPEKNFAADIISNSDLSDVSYLYKYGEYISEHEWKTVEYLNLLSQEKIDQMAESYMEEYFVKQKTDLWNKSIVDVPYEIGTERVIKSVIEKLEAAGKQVTIYRAAVSAIIKDKDYKSGFYGTHANAQYEYDHNDDQGIFLNKKIVERKLEVIKNTYEQLKDFAFNHGAPAALQTAKETIVSPEKNEAAISLTEKQENHLELYKSKSEQLMKQYRNVQETLISIYHKK